MSSRWEGFSAAALEALASGTPCVFSDIPPFVEPYGSVARFHKVGDPSDLSNQLIDLANDPAERRRMGRVGRSLATEKYAIDDVVTAYETLYHRVINEG